MPRAFPHIQPPLPWVRGIWRRAQHAWSRRVAVPYVGSSTSRRNVDFPQHCATPSVDHHGHYIRSLDVTTIHQHERLEHEHELAVIPAVLSSAPCPAADDDGDKFVPARDAVACHLTTGCQRFRLRPLN
jgi:hypothetical protein